MCMFLHLDYVRRNERAQVWHLTSSRSVDSEVVLAVDMCLLESHTLASHFGSIRREPGEGVVSGQTIYFNTKSLLTDKDEIQWYLSSLNNG